MHVNFAVGVLDSLDQITGVVMPVVGTFLGERKKVSNFEHSASPGHIQKITRTLIDIPPW